MRYLVVLFCLFLTISCATTTIHVNKLYLTDKEFKAIKFALKGRGFNVESNKLAYPDTIYSTSIVYSPFVENEGAIDSLESTLTELGYDIGNIDPLVASNHWYTKNTIGLFIVPDGVKPNSGKNTEDIAFEYQAEKCSVKPVLNLNKNGDFTYSELGHLKISGQWGITQYPYILLENDIPYLNFYYEVKRSIRVDRIGKIEVIELQPLNSSSTISKCNMVFGVRI